jgi:hypothetical protein
MKLLLDVFVYLFRNGLLLVEGASRSDSDYEKTYRYDDKDRRDKPYESTDQVLGHEKPLANFRSAFEENALYHKKSRAMYPDSVIWA